MKTRILTLAFIISLFAFAPLLAEPAAPRLPELKLLDQFAGKWSYEFTVFKSEWTVEEKHTFTFTTPLPSSQNGTSTLHFADEKTVEWDVIFKDGDKVFYHSSGKSRRE